MFPPEHYPWTPALDQMKEKTRYILSISEAEMLAMVPHESGGMLWTACPQCPQVKMDGGDFDWEPKTPGRIKCRHCGEVYPHNAKYPDEKFIEIEAPQGMHRLYYYERPENDRQRKSPRIFFRMRAQWEAREYLENQAMMLAELWWKTKDEVCARRAALILLEFARWYPGYVFKYDIRCEPKTFSSYKNSRAPGAGPWYTSRWKWLSFDDVSAKLLRVYDILDGWEGWNQLGGEKARERIVRDFFAAQVDIAIKCEPTYYNLEPALWRDAIYAGRLLNRPDWIHEMARRVKHYMANYFLYDCCWWEASPSYGFQNVNSLGMVGRQIKGYSDPQGYTDARDGTRFDNADFEKDHPFYRQFLDGLNHCRFPDGRFVTVNDTWRNNYIPKWEGMTDADTRKQAQTRLWPAMGLATLKSGDDENAFFSYLNFTFNGGRARRIWHKHWDNLSMGLHACGAELLPDIGYTHTKYRRYAISVAAHNTVMVDGRESDYGQAAASYVDTRLGDFAAGKGFKVVSAENPAAYPGVTSVYRRTLAQAGEKEDEAYLIDVFEIKGGKRHDYLLHGCVDEEMVAGVRGAELKPYEGTLLNEGAKFVRPTADEEDMAGGMESGPGFFGKLQEGIVAGEKGIVWETRFKNRPDAGVRSHVFCDGAAKVYLGEAPGIRRANEDNTKVDDFQAPLFCLRRDGADLSSTYVAVHEAWRGKTHLQGVRVLRVEGGVVVAVDRGGERRDYFAMTLGPAGALSLKTGDGELSLRGRHGFVRLEGGRVCAAHVLGDEKQPQAEIRLVPGIWGRLMRRGCQLAGQSAKTGAIRLVSDKSDGTSLGCFEVDGKMPAPDFPLLLLTFPDRSVRGYNVDRIEADASVSRIYVKERPGFQIDEGKKQISFACHPIQTIGGTQVNYKLARMLNWPDNGRR